MTQTVFRAMGLDQKLYAKEPAQYGPGKSRNEDSFQRLLEYRLYEDLRRGWRVAQPNLEQCGLLIIDYPGLREMCEASEPWSQHPLLNQATPATRGRVVRAFLDFLRKEMAIDAKVLDAEEQKELRRWVEQNLRDPWALDASILLDRSWGSIFAKGRFGDCRTTSQRMMAKILFVTSLASCGATTLPLCRPSKDKTGFNSKRARLVEAWGRHSATF